MDETASGPEASVSSAMIPVPPMGAVGPEVSQVLAQPARRSVDRATATIRMRKISDSQNDKPREQTRMSGTLSKYG